MRCNYKNNAYNYIPVKNQSRYLSLVISTTQTQFPYTCMLKFCDNADANLSCYKSEIIIDYIILTTIQRGIYGGFFQVMHCMK